MLFIMGTSRIWEPATGDPLHINGLGPGKVPITLLRCNTAKHGEKFVTHALKGSLAKARRLPGCQDVELVGRIDPQVHFGRTEACVAEPEGDLPDVASGLERMQCAGMPLISCTR